MTEGVRTWVRANEHLLPRGWQLDEEYAANVFRQIDALHKEGMHYKEIARRVGCSDRTIQRRFGRQDYTRAVQCHGVRAFDGERCEHKTRVGLYCEDHRDQEKGKRGTSNAAKKRR